MRGYRENQIVRDNGVSTYFASDIAYHLHKRERGFDSLLDILSNAAARAERLATHRAHLLLFGQRPVFRR